MSKRRQQTGFSYVDLLLLVVVFLWGGHFGIVKDALAYIHPMAFATLRFISASGVLLLVLWLREGSVGLPSRHDFVWCMALGLFSGMEQVLWMFGLNLTTSAKSALLLAASPLFVTLLALLRGLRPTRRALVGVVGAFLGVAVIVWPYGAGFGAALSGGQLAGDLLTLLAAAFWAAYIVYGSKVLDRNSALRVTTWVFLWTAVVVAVPGAGVLCSETSLLSFPVQVWLSFAYSVFLAGVLGFVLWYNGVQHIGSIRVAIYQYLVPVVAMFLAYFLWREPFNTYQVLGALIVLGGIVVVRLEQVGDRVGRNRNRQPDRALEGQRLSR